MYINFSHNPNLINKDHAGTSGWRNDTQDHDTLVNYIASGHAWSQAVLKNPNLNRKPKIEDVDYAELVAIDVDNSSAKDTKIANAKYLSYNNAIRDEYIKNNSLFIHTSARHTDEWNKFRVVFKLKNKIYDPREFKYTVKYLQNYFHKNFNCDIATNNFDRFWYGSKDCSFKMFGNTFDNTNIIDEIEPPEKNDSKYKNVKLTIKPKQVFEQLKKIDGNSLNYNEWISILKDLVDEFGINTAIKIVNDWSPDLQQGTEYKINSMAYSPDAKTGWQAKKTKGLPNLERILLNKGISLKNEFGDFRVDKETGEVINVKLTNQEKLQNWLFNYTRYRRNAVTDTVEYYDEDSQRFKPLYESELNSIKNELSIDAETLKLPQTYRTKTQILDVLNSKLTPEYDPFFEYFQNLDAWDGENRIQDVIDLMSIDSDNYNLYCKYLLYWLIGTVANALMRGAGQHVLILKGQQGIGKSQFCFSLVPEQLKEYAVETTIDIKNKDHQRYLFSSFLIVIDEIDSLTRKGMETLKQVITQDSIHYRQPYDKLSKFYKKRASFVASVNSAAFLNDATGNRRYLVIEADSIDYEGMNNLNWDQIWAQAYELLNRGCKYWFDQEEIQEINEINSDYQAPDIYEETILKEFKILDSYDDFRLHYDKFDSKAIKIKYNTYLKQSGACQFSDILKVLHDAYGNRVIEAKLKQTLSNMGLKRLRMNHNGRVIGLYALKQKPRAVGADHFETTNKNWN